MLSTFITLPHLLCCSMKHIFWRSNYLLINRYLLLLINNLFIYSTLQFSLYEATFILVVANVLSHDVATIDIWHQNSTHFHLYYCLMLHSSHCSINFLSPSLVLDQAQLVCVEMQQHYSCYSPQQWYIRLQSLTIVQLQRW